MKKLAISCIINMLLISWSASAITINELVSNALKYDGQPLTLQGELVGDVMKRSGDVVWLHINDGSVALGVFASQAQLPGISFKGDFKNHGDQLEIIGIFNRACLQHGGDLDIHASKITVIQPGYKTEKPIDPRKLNAICFLAPLALVMMFIRRWWK